MFNLFAGSSFRCSSALCLYLHFLNVLSISISDRKKQLPTLQPIFITLDPERDTPKVIKEYLKGIVNFFISLFVHCNN